MVTKITRVTQKVFGDTGPTSDFAQFGSLALNNKVFTKDPATIQALNAFVTGWASAIVGQDRPALEDENGILYVAFRQIAYLLQEGIAEWDSGTTYFQNSVCQYNGVFYKSTADNNLNSVPTSTGWAKFLDGAQFDNLNSIPSGAGVIPAANLPVTDHAHALVGSVVQVVNAKTGTAATVTGTIPYDNTIPQNTEGSELLTCTITPKSASNKLRIDVVGMFMSGSAAIYTAALFQDSTSGALAAQAAQGSAASQAQPIAFTYYMTAGTTSATTFKVRGGNTDRNCDFLPLYGGVQIASITITEVKV